jgi:hypothetical protein
MLPRLAISILKQSRSLDILSVPRISEVSVHPDLMDLPTWVPDWSICDEADILTRYDTTDDFKYKFQAGLGSRADLNFGNEGNWLKIFGFEVDKIDEVGYLWEPRHQEHSSTWSWLKNLYLHATSVAYYIANWVEVARVWSGKSYIGGEDTIDAFWRTIVVDNYYGDVYNGRADFLLFYRAISWYSPLHKLRIERVGPLYAIISLILLWIQGLTISRGTPPDGVKRLQHGIGITSDKRILRTRIGYIDLGPRLCRAGDRIALFKGDRVPLVIRSYGDSWQLIGESYVHGIMYGEIFRRDEV